MYPKSRLEKLETNFPPYIYEYKQEHFKTLPQPQKQPHWSRQGQKLTSTLQRNLNIQIKRRKKDVSTKDKI